jgi:cyclic pyranopterin monophosphate synthase
MESAQEMMKRNQLTHLDELGKARMVDIGEKSATARRAVAEGEICMSGKAMALLKDSKTPKGDVFTVAKVAGIAAAKRTSELIPLCHPLPLSRIDLQFAAVARKRKVMVRAEVCTTAQTGVEMEALTAVSVALLTIYDMMKSCDKAMTISGVRLIYKEGGKTGVFRRKD